MKNDEQSLTRFRGHVTCCWLTVVKHAANAAAQHVRWDITTLSTDVVPGGSASATAADGSTITLTGSGTFVAPASASGSSRAATGGGTWKIFPPGSSTASASGTTYQAEGLVRFDEAPGSLTGVNDLIRELEDAQAGLAILRIAYSDGDRGVLAFSCSLPSSPAPIPEGVSASKSFVDFFNIVQQPVTIFHVAD